MSSTYPSWIVHRQIPRILRGERIVPAARFLRAACSASSAAKDRPVFVLSAGWRSGSTLLQRLICSSDKTLLWGEPFGEFVPVHRLCRTIESLTEDSPHLTYTCENLEKPLAESWIANLNPGIDALRRGHHGYFQSQFGDAASERGYTNWGIKYVRVTGYHAHYLKWIFPQCRIIYLVRNPIDAYRSYKRKSYWFTERPDFRIDSATKFMSHWAYLADSFLKTADELDACLVRYDQLAKDPAIISRLSDYLDCELDASVISQTIGSRKKSRFKVQPWERWICRRLTSTLQSALGFNN